MSSSLALQVSALTWWRLCRVTPKKMSSTCGQPTPEQSRMSSALPRSQDTPLAKLKSSRKINGGITPTPKATSSSALLSKHEGLVVMARDHFLTSQLAPAAFQRPRLRLLLHMPYSEFILPHNLEWLVLFEQTCRSRLEPVFFIYRVQSIWGMRLLGPGSASHLLRDI